MRHECDGSIVEIRIYNTVYGPWKYYTRNDGQINLDGKENYLALGTIEAYNKYCEYFGKTGCVRYILRLMMVPD